MTSDVSNNEESLVSRAKNGDMMARKAIYKLHIRYLTAVCSRYILNAEDAMDVLQDSFVKIYSSLSDFEYRGKGSLRGWMCRIVVNEAMKFLRRNSAFQFSGLSDSEYEIACEEPEIDDIPASVIHGLIRELPDGYRTIFNLFVVEGRSHKEIARMLNIKEGTSASQFHRAKGLLASKIKEYKSSFETMTI